MTLPLMMLVDQNGNVAKNNIHVGPELEGDSLGALCKRQARRTRHVALPPALIA